MSKPTPASRVRATYELIKAQSATFPVQVLCRVLEIAPSGYSNGRSLPVRASSERQVCSSICARPARRVASIALRG